MELRTLLSLLLSGSNLKTFPKFCCQTKVFRNLKRLVLCACASLLPLCACIAQPRSPLQGLKDSLGNIPYIFEGEISSSKLFVGNEQGEVTKSMEVEWKDSVGTIKDFGATFFPFVRAEIEITKSHKGKIRTRDPITILQKISYIDDVWYEIIPAGDTLLRYELSQGKTLLHAFNALIPGKGFSPRRLYFCKEIRTTAARGRGTAPSYYSLDIFLQIPLNPENNSITLDRKAHPGLFPLLFYREADLRDLVEDL